MRRVRQWVDPARLAVYEGIIELYAPYVLIRCARYTNRRRQAQQIGAYSLISSCFLARELGPALALGRIVDLVAGVVGPDVVSNGEGQDWWGRSDELLIVDQRVRKMAQALNALKGPLREVLVLRYVSGLDPDALARLLQRPAAEIVACLDRAQRLLTRRLEGPRDEGCGVRGLDVRSWLVEFTAGLDGGWISEVAECALDYLTTCGRRHHRRRGTSWNCT